MRSRFLCAMVCTLLLGAFLTGCGKNAESVFEDGLSSEAGYRRTTLYYLSDEGYIVPVMKLIPWEEGIGKAALSYLVDQDGNRESASAQGLMTVIPAGTTYTLRIGDDKNATLDLIGLTDLDTAEAEQAMVTAIVNTLTEFGSIDTVSIKVNGNKLKALPHGTSIAKEMSAFALNAEKAEEDVITDSAYRLTLYYPNRSGSLNVPVTRLTNIEPTMESAIRELIKGPRLGELMNPFPEGTELLGLSFADGAAVVNFNSAFKAVEEVEGLALTAHDALSLTLGGIKPIYMLEVYVDGKPYNALSAATSAPFYPNEFMK